MPDIWLVSTMVCTVFEIWHNHCSGQSSASFHKHKCKFIHHLHCTEGKQLSFIITMESWDVCLIRGNRKSKSLFYHKFWAWFQLTDFWHKCWTRKDTQVKSSTTRKALQSLFAYFVVTQYKLMYLILIVCDRSWWLGEVPEGKQISLQSSRRATRTQRTIGWSASPQSLVR